MRSVTDVLRELKDPGTTPLEPPAPTTAPLPAVRIGGGTVSYTSSGLASEAAAFAAALADSNLPSQPSPPPSAPNLAPAPGPARTDDAHTLAPLAAATSPHVATTSHD